MNAFYIRYAEPQEVAYVAPIVTQHFSELPLLYRELPHLSQVVNNRHFVCLVGGEIAAYAHVQRRTLAYGRAELKVACIGPSFTLPAFQPQDYTTIMMLHLLAYMVESRVHLALVNDSAEHPYHPFGFSAVWPYYRARFVTAELARLRPRAGLRPLRPPDLEEVAELHQLHWGGRVTLTRSEKYWLWLTQRESLQIRVLDDAEGRIDGYIAATSEGDSYTELVAQSEDSALSLLSYLGRAYSRLGRETCEVHLLPDDALLSFARPYVSVNVSAQYRPSGGWMARLLDTAGLMRVLLPELEAQAAAAYADFPTGQLTFRLQPDTVTIGLKGYSKSFCRLDHRDFIQILFGSLRPNILALRQDLPDDARHLLELLFPPRLAAIAPLDWF